MDLRADSERFSSIIRGAALFLAYGFMILLVHRITTMAQEGVTLIGLLRALADVYLMILFAFVGLKGTRPPKWLFPVEQQKIPPLQIDTWPKRLAAAGFAMAVIGLVLWNAVIRAGASEPPSLTENLAVALFVGGIFLCFPLLFSGLAALGSSLEKKERSN